MRRSAISIHHGKIRGVDLAQTRALARDRSVAHIRARRTSRSTNLDISHFLPISLLPFGSFDELGFFPVRKIVAAKNPQYFVFYDQFNGERSVRKMIRPIVWKVLLRRRVVRVWRIKEKRCSRVSYDLRTDPYIGAMSLFCHIYFAI